MKILSAAAIAAALVLLSPSVMAMNSAELLGNPVRYRVIFADKNQAVYADMESVTAMESRDYPSSVENFTLTMYAERYAKKPTAMDYQEGNVVDSIQQYDATVYGNKRNETYRIKKDLIAVYDKDGAQIGDASWGGKKVSFEADDIYFSLFRAVHATETE